MVSSRDAETALRKAVDAQAAQRQAAREGAKTGAPAPEEGIERPDTDSPR